MLPFDYYLLPNFSMDYHLPPMFLSILAARIMALVFFSYSQPLSQPQFDSTAANDTIRVHSSRIGDHMTKILFVCHGNICRSTMAQFVFADLARQAGRADEFVVDSAATSREELGNDVHPGTRRALERAGIPCGHHRSRQVGPADYREFDYIVGMDAENLAGIYRLLLGERDYGWSWDPVSEAEARRADPEDKVSLLLDWTDHPRDVADPWYTHNFQVTLDDVLAGCSAMLARL